jgi:hypothetical protein
MSTVDISAQKSTSRAAAAGGRGDERANESMPSRWLDAHQSCLLWGAVGAE